MLQFLRSVQFLRSEWPFEAGVQCRVSCREVAVVCDESKLAPLVAEYNKTKEKVKDLTDEWVGAMRKGSEVTDKPRKYIKRKRVKLAALPGALGKATGGLGGAGREAQDYFGKDAQDLSLIHI